MPSAVAMYKVMKIRMKMSNREGIIEIRVSISSLKSFIFFTRRATRIILNVRITVIADFKLNCVGMIF